MVATSIPGTVINVPTLMTTSIQNVKKIRLRRSGILNALRSDESN
jgi:hypothetical protein